MSTPPSPFVDHAAPVLAGEPTITDEQRADLWDAFHTKNTEELVQHLTPLAVPDDFKHKLFTAKQAATPAPAPLDQTTAVMTKMAAMDPKVLDLAEAHPNVLKVMTAAAAPAKGAESASGASKGAAKGNTPAGGKSPAPLAQPPRIDGLPHLPPIPDGHRRLLASDGGLHDVPDENVEKARAIDPRLHVLNP